jgi:hypothetical protein
MKEIAARLITARRIRVSLDIYDLKKGQHISRTRMRI